jgi:putative addiction module component (TIGR02574 family)
MDLATVLKAAEGLSVEDRRTLIARVEEGLPAIHPELTPELKAELDRRLADHAANPADVLTWEQVIASVARPR